MIGWIHHVTLRVADVDEARERWSLLHGLSGEGGLLRCGYEDFCLELVPAGSGRAPGSSTSRTSCGRHHARRGARALEAAGVTPREVDVPVRGPACAWRLDGNGVLGHQRRVPSAPRPLAARRPAAPATLLAGHPSAKLGHVNYLTADTPRIAGWYERVLGFAVTDWIGDDAVWLYVNGNHHVLASSTRATATCTMSRSARRLRRDAGRARPPRPARRGSPGAPAATRWRRTSSPTCHARGGAVVEL